MNLNIFEHTPLPPPNNVVVRQTLPNKIAKHQKCFGSSILHLDNCNDVTLHKTTTLNIL